MASDFAARRPPVMPDPLPARSPLRAPDAAALEPLQAGLDAACAAEENARMTTTPDPIVTPDVASIEELAGFAFDCFERAERPDGDSYTRLKDGAPEWLRNLVHAAHGGMLPDDWRYDSTRDALGMIHDTPGADLDDLAHEFADGNVDVYSGARVAWLASNTARRSGYCDEAQDEGLAGGSVTEIIGAGQYVESLRVYQTVREMLEETYEEISDAA